MTITIRIDAGDGEGRARAVPDTDQAAEGATGEVVVVEIPAAGDPFTAVEFEDS